MTDNLLNNKARNHSHYTLYQQFLEKIDHSREFFLPVKFLHPTKLFTPNRLDIKYRINFLENVLLKNKSFKNTLYYQFVSDKDRNLFLNGDQLSKNFLNLSNEVKQNGIKTPIIVGKFNSKTIKTQYFINNKFNWKEFPNETGYQLIDGAHRLSLALFLKLDFIPVKIYSPLYFEIPNFTDYINVKENEYKQKLDI